ncbi:nicotinate (nicotinamide) nucleotide adenylyltransferase [Leptospira perolatii]|uniref:Probable nicotinate-nucleotide adenylyltransferase n=1 Tax=Leptospira perolatii TaxID=2023191 RepID=A0A2M9ZNP0_9LEPT|nr:nicotinate (nicotinamide) nucleotide adenylyltransferase [Leptospira perolatii]PJZ69693.1 nicotinate (nicotinamide) nucleotide adenylyltransferase [Leptospira perolatii]PJZ73700.1 nicotinate (nicotinamide) nucleotide adenylyltransferase [Leptospira perolatii]
MYQSSITGIFGGSFDPPHIGHREIAEHFLQKFPNSEELIVVPNYHSPWKENQANSPDFILSMLGAEFSGLSKIRIWDWELRSNRKNYTYETVCELDRILPTKKFALLIGEDNYSEFHRWRNWESILDRILLLLVFRRTSPLIPENQNLAKYKQKILFLENRLLPAASSDLRKYLPQAIQEKKKPIELSDLVWNIILKSGYYT